MLLGGQTPILLTAMPLPWFCIKQHSETDTHGRQRGPKAVKLTGHLLLSHHHEIPFLWISADKFCDVLNSKYQRKASNTDFKM